ncbi:class I lanthipeptide [Dokdonia ponticola]|uniref:Class I lanthipeptide n=1 Tax=Dokdonia ponticola TaxID=2041041 RepID=A0ABV9I3H1_9FLAO
MKKKSIKGLSLNKDIISSFNRMHIQGGGIRTTPGNGCDTAQSFCGYKSCGPACEVATASVQTVCCD